MKGSLEITPRPNWEDKGTYVEPRDSKEARVPQLEIDDASTYIDKDGSNNMTFTDAVTGTKTLAQLSAAGSGDFMADGSVPMTGDLLAGDTNFYIRENTSLSNSITISGGTNAVGSGAWFRVNGNDIVGAGKGSFSVSTPNAAKDSNVTRLSIAGNADVANAAWASTLHTDLNLGDYLGLWKTDVDSAVEAELWYDDSENVLKYYNGAAVITIANFGDIVATKLDDFTTPDDNTDLDFSITKHGLTPKGTNVGNFLKDDGTWAAPAGGGDMLKATYDTDDDGLIGTASGGTEWDSSAQTGFPYVTAGSWAAVSKGIANGNVVTVDQADAADNDIAKFTANGLEGRSYTELRSDLNVADGADVTANNAPQAHAASHAPQTGGDALSCTTPAELGGVQATGEGTADYFARSDHQHAINHAITDNHLVTVDQADAADNDIAKFTANGLEGRSYAEVKQDLDLEAGTDFPALTTFEDHSARHENGGGDEISVADLSGVLADDQHIIDAEAVSAVEAAGVAFAENKGITLDIALSADGKWNSILQIAGTAGTNLAFGEAVYFAVADSKWEKAKGDAEATVAPMTGLVVVAGNENAAITVMLIGSIRADAQFPALTVGGAVFISAATAGAVTTTELTTGQYQKAIGWAVDANTVIVTGNPSWVKVG